MINLIQGDCIEKMKDIPDNSIDLILTDPPYGTTACKWDSVIPFEEMWGEIERVSKKESAILLFGSEPFSSYLRCSNIKLFKYDIIWEKQKPSNFQLMNYQIGKVHEIISVFSKSASSYTKNKNSMNYYPVYTGDSYTQNVKIYGKENANLTLGDNDLYNKMREDNIKEFKGKLPRSVLKYNVDIVNKLHPTQKPVDLLEFLLELYSKENDTVLDFTMGSCSTGIACLNKKRNFIGIEKDEKYFTTAKYRITEHEKMIIKNNNMDGLFE